MPVKMTIGFDASRAFVSQPTGTETYSYQLLKAFAKLDCQERFCLYLRPNQIITKADRHWLPQGWEIKIIPWDFFWTQGGLALETWQNPTDVLFIPAHVIPFLKNPRVPVVTTVHDLPLEFFPHQKTLIQRIYLNRWVESLRAKLAKKVICVSFATKNDLTKKLGVPEDKIKVIYEGSEAEIFNLKFEIFNFEKVKRKYSIRGDYFLSVGTLHPRKNLVRLIEAFSRFTKSADGIPVGNIQLLICGKKGWGYQEIFEAPKKYGVEEGVRFLDYVEFADLPYLYAGSMALVYPSLYEGFGLPILEAYSAGTLVLTSNISSMPEVGGDEAVYIDPFDVVDIARGLSEVVKINQNLGLREEKIAKERLWLRNFTWEKAARETLEVLKL